MTATATENGTILRDLGEHGKVEFIDGDGRQRAYWLFAGGKRSRLVSVTTVLGCLEKRALYSWYEARGAEGRSGRLSRVSLIRKSPPEDAVEVVKASRARR